MVEFKLDAKEKNYHFGLPLGRCDFLQTAFRRYNYRLCVKISFIECDEEIPDEVLIQCSVGLATGEEAEDYMADYEPIAARVIKKDFEITESSAKEELENFVTNDKVLNFVEPLLFCMITGVDECYMDEEGNTNLDIEEYNRFLEEGNKVSSKVHHLDFTKSKRKQK